MTFLSQPISPCYDLIMHSFQRVCILGNSGSGKSTLAQALGARYGLPVIHLDQELLHGQFEPYPEDEERARHDRLIHLDKWIIDGRYSKLMSARFARADLVIFLNVPRWLVIPRAWQRTRQPDTRLGAPVGAKQVYNQELLAHQLKFNRRRRLQQLVDSLKEHPYLKLIVLKPGSVAKWMAQIEYADKASMHPKCRH